MDLSEWFAEQLPASARGFAWAVEQVPAARRAVPPPADAGLGEWSVARHAFHLAYYEEAAALPSMRQWLGGPPPDWAAYDEEAAWGADRHRALPALLERFRAARAEQVVLLPRLADAWDEPRQTGWGRVTLSWVVTKTYQHAAEHTSDVLQIALFWDPADPSGLGAR